MHQRPNIVWFLVDSIRNYPTDPGQDLRGKLPVMDRFAQDGVEFKTCVTTAPSTIMSISAMMTGLPAYFLARNYDDFRFDSRFYSSMANVLKRHGYASYAFLRGPETREKFRHLLDPVPRRYWPPHLRHRFKWTNEELDLVLERVLRNGVPMPAFLFFHYSPHTASSRGMLKDPAISERVETTWAALRRAGFTRNNTIYVMCSDHGFPDPSTGMSTEWEVKNRLTHDLVLTDDNILIPLAIQYPGCIPKQVTTPVNSLDLFPTLLDLAGIPDTRDVKSTTAGTSLVRLMETDDERNYPRRFFRSDSRLMLQTGRSTAIRSRRFKYIRYHDEYRVPVAGQSATTSEMFIDLQHDPTELRNLLSAETMEPGVLEVLNACRAEFERTEARAVEAQVEYFLARHGDTFLPKERIRGAGRDPKMLLIFEPDTASFAEIGVSAIARAYPRAAIDVLTSRTGLSDNRPGTVDETYFYVHRENGSIEPPSLDRNGSALRYDLAILFVQNPSAPIVADLLGVARKVRVRRQFVLDCNFNAYRPRRYWYYRFRALIERLPYVLEEPAFLLLQLSVGGRLLAQHLLKRLGLWERWERPQTPGESAR